MKILLIGNGGRENAIAWKIFNSKSFIETNSRLYCTIGNPGIDKFAEAINIKPAEINKLTEFALNEKIDFTVVGPEVPLSLGIVNEFEKNNLRIFGPSKEAAEIESSKIFAKELMKEFNIPTAKFRVFSNNNLDESFRFVRECNYPVVIKADGLAAGKGVVIAYSPEDAEKTIEEFVSGNSLGEAGLNFIIEEFLNGEEVSVFAITDGENFVLLPFSQDHKKILEGDKGKNTGGMGAVAPVKKFMTDELENKIEEKIIEPVLKGLKQKGRIYKGCLYCGLIIVEDEPFVIEFNCRFGDPETQAVLPLIKSDFLQLLIDSAKGTITNYELLITNDKVCCVVLVSDGYPDEYEIGKEVSGLEKESDDCLIFHSGTKFSNDNKKILSSGGRVLSVVGISKVSLNDAVKIAYANVNKINFENKYFRKDIGFRQLNNSAYKEEVVS